MRSTCLTLFLVFCAIIPDRVIAADDFPPTYVQAFIGASQFDEDGMTFIKTSSDNPEQFTTSDLSTMPCLGFGGQYAFTEGEDHFGLDGTVLFGWRSRNSSLTISNGQTSVKLDTSLWLLDLALGIYGQTILGENWRLYGAAGPLMMFGDYSEDTEEEDLEATPHEVTRRSSSDSQFGVGGYARLGLEYRLVNNAFMGVSMRGVSTNLEFENTLDAGRLNGVQWFITYSQSVW